MMKTPNDNLIPFQEIGTQMDAVAERTFEHHDDARAFFQIASKRLLDINRWGDLAGLSSFQLMDPKGNKVDRDGQKGDYIRIDIPGPGTSVGHGYDWVNIEEVGAHARDDEELLLIRVRPCEYPLSTTGNTAHFLRNDATSTFIMRRQGNRLTAEEHGRNEVANTGADQLLDRGRNLLVGFAAKIGLAYPQWQSLVNALLAE